MITTQGDREMHSNISIDLSKKSNSKRTYSNNHSYWTNTKTYNTRTPFSQSLYAQAVNWQLKNPTPTRRVHTTTTTTSSTAHT